MYLVTHSVLLRALGWALFHSLWQMGLLWAFYQLLIRSFREMAAHIRHSLAVTMLGAGAAWSLLTFGNAWQDALAAAASPAGMGDGTANLAASAGMGAWLVGSRAVRFLQDEINQGMPFVSSVYLLFLLLHFIRYWNNYRDLSRLRNSGLHKIPGELRVFVAETGRQLGIGRVVKVWFSERVEGPLTLGFWKPVILLPLATVNQLSMAQVEAILLHELAHIRRNDYLLNLGLILLEIVFFFNPFVRLLLRDIRREREHCCDDWVLRFRYEPKMYLAALLSLARQAGEAGRKQQHKLAMAATGAGENDQFLLRRARRILDQPDPAGRIRVPGRTVLAGLLPLAIAALALFPSTAQLTQSAQEQTATPAPLAAASPEPSPEPGPASTARAAYVERGNTYTSFHSAFYIYAYASSPDQKQIYFSSTETASTSGRQVKPAQNSQPDNGQLCKNPRRGQGQQQFSGNRMITRIGNAGVQGQEVDADGGADEAAYDATYASDAGKLMIQAAKTEKREYSIHSEPAEGTEPVMLVIPGNTAPYVPNTSFSFRERQDTIRPAERLAEERQLAALEVERAMVKLQRDLQNQLKNLNEAIRRSEQITGTTEAVQRAHRDILRKQLQLQQDYLNKQMDLQRQLEKTRKKHIIIYI